MWTSQNCLKQFHFHNFDVFDDKEEVDEIEGFADRSCDDFEDVKNFVNDFDESKIEDENDFELEDGQDFQHPIPLDEIPTIDEFQEIYEKWIEIFNKEIENQ